jgi:hypothetical protein
MQMEERGILNGSAGIRNLPDFLANGSAEVPFTVPHFRTVTRIAIGNSGSLPR